MLPKCVQFASTTKVFPTFHALKIILYFYSWPFLSFFEPNSMRAENLLAQNVINAINLLGMSERRPQNCWANGGVGLRLGGGFLVPIF